MPIEPDELDRMAGIDPRDPATVGDIPPLCPTCGYNLTGAPTTICPECGQVYERKELRRQTMEMRVRVQQLSEINDWISIGFKVAVCGLVLRLLGLGLRNTAAGVVIAPISSVFSVVFGIAAICLGLSVVSFLKLPAWAREQGRVKPNVLLAVVDVCLGVAQLTMSLF